MVNEENTQKTLDELENESKTSWEWDDELQKVEKKYQIVSSIIFKYWILILTIIVTITIFFVELQKRKTLSFENKYEAKQILLIGQFDRNQKQIKEYETNDDTKITIKHWYLNISDDTISSYNNLISYKWFTLPKWTFLYEPQEIKGIEYFNDSAYDISELEKIVNRTILLNYNEIWSKENNSVENIPLTNNSIENTFYISCANQHKIFNWVCNKYITDFLNSFFVYKINDDFDWFNKTIKNIIKKKKYKSNACIWIDNFIKYTNTTPPELEQLFTICWEKYINDFDITQAFIDVKDWLDNKFIKPNISKYKEINEFKLISYQQILYNNLENGILPSEWDYKYYTDYLSNILKSQNQDILSPFYFDLTYRFNNTYLIPLLNKIKYQSSLKKDEIEWIISDLEIINNWNNIEGTQWLKNKIINKDLEKEATIIESNINSQKDDIMTTLLQNIKWLSYLKIINDEIDWNLIRIDWYISLKMINWELLPVPFWSLLENKNGKLIVKEFVLSFLWWWFEINDILKIILQENDYTIWEIYEYIQKNIAVYESSNTNLTPCIQIKDKLEKLDINWIELLNCDKEKVNIIKWVTWGKILYKFEMNNYNIKSIQTTNKEIQDFINKNFSWITTNATTIINIIPNIISYDPWKWKSNALIWNSNAVTAIEDFKTYLWVNISDIWERNWKVAAEFSISNIEFIWIYDINTKLLWPIFLKGKWDGKDEAIYTNFSLYLTSENQYEINRFIIEPIGYLYNLDKKLTEKYLPDLLEEYLKKIFSWFILD